MKISYTKLSIRTFVSISPICLVSPLFACSNSSEQKTKYAIIKEINKTPTRKINGKVNGTYEFQWSPIPTNSKIEISLSQTSYSDNEPIELKDQSWSVDNDGNTKVAIITSNDITKTFTSRFDLTFYYKLGTEEKKSVTLTNLEFSYDSEKFNWDEFIDPNGTGIVEDHESDWNLLTNAINNGLTSNDIENAISSSTIYDFKPFNWSNEYFAMVNVNSQLHKIRLISFNQDNIDNQTKALTTWEFANLISDSNGYSLGCKWNSYHQTKNSNYFESDINEILNNEEETIPSYLQWFSHDGVDWSASSINKSVYMMLPISLRNNIKSIQKNINIHKEDKWKHDTSTSVKLFLPTMANYFTNNDVNSKNIVYNGEGGGQYQYYKHHIFDNDINTIVSCLHKKCLANVWGPFCYWLSSPDIDGMDYVYVIKLVRQLMEPGVLISTDAINFFNNAIAPCFCL